MARRKRLDQKHYRGCAEICGAGASELCRQDPRTRGPAVELPMGPRDAWRVCARAETAVADACESLGPL
eukprot:4007954-Pyramimonas_sp.AAC.1